jgi:hypothetical protein
MRPGIARAGANQIDGRDASRLKTFDGCVRALDAGEDCAGSLGEQSSATACPPRLASLIGPRDSARSACAPSSDNTIATSVMSSGYVGVRADRHLAAAAKARHDGPLGVERARESLIVDGSHPRHHTAVGGTRFDRDDALAGRRHARGIGSGGDTRAMPRRIRPAEARTSASYSPSSSFRRRVSRLPRIGRNRAPGNESRQLRGPPDAARADPWALPSRAPALRTLSRSASPTSWSPSDGASAEHDGVRASSRGSAADDEAAGSTTGMSLLLWTARSISPRAARPRFPSRTSACRRSARSSLRQAIPEVLITTISHSVGARAQQR